MTTQTASPAHVTARSWWDAPYADRERLAAGLRPLATEVIAHQHDVRFSSSPGASIEPYADAHGVAAVEIGSFVDGAYAAAWTLLVVVHEGANLSARDVAAAIGGSIASQRGLVAQRETLPDRRTVATLLDDAARWRGWGIGTYRIAMLSPDIAVEPGYPESIQRPATRIGPDREESSLTAEQVAEITAYRDRCIDEGHHESADLADKALHGGNGGMTIHEARRAVLDAIARQRR